MMEVLDIRILHGPNAWAGVPVAEARVVLGLEGEAATSALPGFAAQLADWLGGRLPRRHPPATLPEFLRRLAAGMTLRDAVAQLALQLETIAGADVEFAAAQPAERSTECRLALEIEEERLAVACLRAAAQACDAALGGGQLDFAAEMQRLRNLAEDICLGPSTRTIVRAAKTRGIPARRMSTRSLVQLGHGSRQRRIVTAISDRGGSIAELISQDKQLTKQLLAAAGVPVPEGRLARDPADAWAAACAIGLPVVVKPLNGNHGRGVFTDLTTREQVEGVFAAALNEGDSVIVERFARGNEHRLLVVGDRVVAAVRGEPAVAVGDGRRTVIELMAELNRDPRRGADDDCPLAQLEFEPTTDALIRHQGYTRDSVPPAGAKVLFQRNGNLSVEVTNQLHPAVAQCAVRAVKAVGLDIAGLDIVAQDISQPLESQGGVVVEVNAGPGLQPHLWPAVGPVQPVGEAIVEHLFPGGQDGRIPIAGVLAGDRTATARLAAGTFMAFGEVALADRAGECFTQRQGKPVNKLPRGVARQLLLSPMLDAAVFEIDPAETLADGLPFDRCQVAVVALPDDDSEAWQATAQVLLRSVLPGGAVVLPAGRGALDLARGDVRTVLTADDPSVASLAEHRRRGGAAVFLRGQTAVVAQGEAEVAQIALGPLMGDNCRATAAVLQAIAAGWAAGLAAGQIAAGLAAFAAAHEATCPRGLQP